MFLYSFFALVSSAILFYVMAQFLVYIQKFRERYEHIAKSYDVFFALFVVT